MPLLLAPVFNSVASGPVQINLKNGFRLESGNDKLYKLSHRYLRNLMNENRLYFKEKVSADSMFLIADYPQMKVTEDRSYIELIENLLNMASGNGVCSIPYVLTIEQNQYGISYLKRSLDGPAYLFDEEKRQVFEQLLRQEGHFPPVPFRRYLLSLERENWEDRLLDLWIALESLFVPDGKKGEITYKVRMRTAYYFADTREQRKRLSDFIKHSYNHRSEIVHSGKSPETGVSEEVQTLAELVRITLINMYGEDIKPQELKTRLDELILSGESYREVYHPAYFRQLSI
ncbi:hypothetical protein LOK74_07210 [Brevibacillus humidisoli]|uniref:HEPN domain-containing protein n=1 Tax=Brevibacillus humidisoli TaxID=2895522 RepID=UPI001E28FF54|nr:HEPN domain-containing protein [Brevibacillus humidisoli]UFJ42273.1 hypothetical protein LOK74_07210 [Brevibacillus humidisoli]